MTRLWLALLAVGVLGARDLQAPGVDLPREVARPLLEAVGTGYNELFDEAEKLEFSAAQLQRMREYFRASERYCKGRFAEEAKRWEEEAKRLEAELKRRTKSIDDAGRRELHCNIQNARLRAAHARAMEKNAIPVAYQNRLAKLDVIGKWPAELAEIRRRLAEGTHQDRPYGDVKDIGFRSVGEGQEKDIKTGQKAIEEMKREQLLPREMEDAVVVGYVRELAERVAARSDLRVPLKVAVLDSPEINAFALPGGYLYVHRGLIEATEDEAQLAGVIAHEIAHSAARHGHRLMRRATIANIIYTAAQMAAMVATGGVAGIGTYYALQYGFYGLGLLLSLDLLGVSRDFEMEADQLGVQYAWSAGYDPTGFVRFFDVMATREGYVRGMSWFRTHPPFYERMVHTKREILYLPAKEALIRQTSRFEEMKRALARVPAAEELGKKKPSLRMPEAECPKPELPEYKPGQGVEELCGIPVI